MDVAWDNAGGAGSMGDAKNFVLGSGPVTNNQPLSESRRRHVQAPVVLIFLRYGRGEDRLSIFVGNINARLCTRRIANGRLGPIYYHSSNSGGKITGSSIVFTLIS